MDFLGKIKSEIGKTILLSVTVEPINLKISDKSISIAEWNVPVTYYWSYFYLPRLFAYHFCKFICLTSQLFCKSSRIYTKILSSKNFSSYRRGRILWSLVTVLESDVDFVKIKSFSSLKSDDCCFLRIWEDVVINLNYTHISLWLFFGMFFIPSWILISKVSAENLKIIARSIHFFIKWTNFIMLNSVYLLVVHWLGLHAFNAGALGSIFGRGARSHMPRLRLGAAK